MSRAMGWVWASVVVLTMVGVSTAGARTENFDSDPGWTGVGNTTGGNTFTFSNTNHTGATAGEAGGDFVSESSGMDYYADTALGGTLNQQMILSATGRFTLLEPPDINDGQFEIGWFDTTPSSLFDNGPFEGVVMHIRERTASTYRVNVRVGDQRSNASDIELNVGTDYLFDLSYDPNGLGTNIGQAYIEIRDPSNNNLLFFNDTPAYPSGGTPWQMNAFGMLTGDAGAASISGEGYFDSLEYTVVPEPAGLTLIGLAALALARRRRG